MKRQHIGLHEQLAKFSNTFTFRRNRFRIRIVSQNLHAKGTGNLRHPAANGAEADESQRSALKLKRFMR